MKYKVVEMFTSINGEGVLAGQLAVFVRFAGCNLQCSFCDTTWANAADVPYTDMTPEEIIEKIRKTGVKNVTLTGGEPLLQSGIHVLLEALSAEKNLQVEIETNGSVDLTPFTQMDNPPSFTMDYKLPGSGMESQMCISNFSLLTQKDTVKFVAGSVVDLERAREIIDAYHLTEQCHVYLSPVFGSIEPAQMVTYMIENNMNDVNLQLQMHKVIWDPQARGV
jgi:7-carboxy-7-deazaguanine synthase